MIPGGHVMLCRGDCGFGKFVEVFSCSYCSRGHEVYVFGMVAGHMAAGDQAFLGVIVAATFLRGGVHQPVQRAAGAEVAACDVLRGARQVAVEDDLVRLRSTAGSGTGTAESSARV